MLAFSGKEYVFNTLLLIFTSHAIPGAYCIKRIIGNCDVLSFMYRFPCDSRSMKKLQFFQVVIIDILLNRAFSFADIMAGDVE